jgi:uncharacterized protein (DUF58 family)
MKWVPSRKLIVCLWLVLAGVVGGLAAGRLEPVVLVAPFAVLAAVAFGGRSDIALGMAANVDRETAMEGEEVLLTIDLVAHRALPWLEIAVVDDAGLAAEQNRLLGVGLRRGERRRLTVPLVCHRWGNYSVGDVWIRATDRLGMFRAEGHLPSKAAVRVYPAPEHLRALVRPLDTQAASGTQLARRKSDGVEFADLRPFAFGDRVREINWRATARRGELWVNERHPDRTGDVVLLLDAFADATLSQGVRAAYAISNAYLSQLDRVGLVSFGGVMRLVRPNSGLRQLYVIVDTLLSSQVFKSFAWKDVGVVPPRVLPPKALVLALSPLEDERALTALVDLRSRGADLVVVEVAPDPLVVSEPGVAGDVARRLWSLERARRRDRYRSLGVPVVEWTAERPLTEVLREVQAWPRGGRSAV